MQCFFQADQAYQPTPDTLERYIQTLWEKAQALEGENFKLRLKNAEISVHMDKMEHSNTNLRKELNAYMYRNRRKVRLAWRLMAHAYLTETRNGRLHYKVCGLQEDLDHLHAFHDDVLQRTAYVVGEAERATIHRNTTGRAPPRAEACPC